MQIVENWTCVTGIVMAIGHPAADVRTTIQMKIERTKAVDGFRSLLPENPGSSITVSMPESFDPEKHALQGKTINLPVRMVRKGKYHAFADWSPENGSSLCGPNPSAKIGG